MGGEVAGDGADFMLQDDDMIYTWWPCSPQLKDKSAVNRPTLIQLFNVDKSCG